MYVLARHVGETIVIANGAIRIKVLSVTGKIARIGIEAPKEISIEREEVILQEKQHDVERREKAE